MLSLPDMLLLFVVLGDGANCLLWRLLHCLSFISRSEFEKKNTQCQPMPTCTWFWLTSYVLECMICGADPQCHAAR